MPLQTNPSPPSLQLYCSQRWQQHNFYCIVHLTSLFLILEDVWMQAEVCLFFQGGTSITRARMPDHCSGGSLFAYTLTKGRKFPKIRIGLGGAILSRAVHTVRFPEGRGWDPHLQEHHHPSTNQNCLGISHQQCFSVTAWDSWVKD